MSSSKKSSTKQDKTDQVRLAIDRIRNHRWMIPLILGGTLIIAVGSFTDALEKIGKFISEVYQSLKAPPVPGPNESLISVNGRKKVWGIENPHPEPDGNSFRLAQTQLHYDNVGFPILSFIFKNDSDKVVLIKGVHIRGGWGGGGWSGPESIIVTRSLEPVATWNLSISEFLVALNDRFARAKDMQTPRTILIAPGDAANVEIRLINKLDGELIYPDPMIGLSLTFTFEIDGNPRRL